MSPDAGTPTPRTDAVAYRAYGHLTDQVDAGFARQLERELSAAQAALKLAEQQDRNESLDSICRFLDNEATLTWREVLAKYDRAEAAEARLASVEREQAQQNVPVDPAPAAVTINGGLASFPHNVTVTNTNAFAKATVAKNVTSAFTADRDEALRIEGLELAAKIADNSVGAYYAAGWREVAVAIRAEIAKRTQ